MSRVKSPSITLLSAEFYKHLVCGKGVYILVFALLLKYITSKIYYYPGTGSIEAIYKSYMEELKGPVTDEKLQYIEDEFNYIYVTIDKYSEMTGKYHAGEISYGEYQKYLSQYNYATYCKTACDRMIRRRDYLLSVNASFSNIEFLYEEGVSRLLNTPIDIIGILTAIFFMRQCVCDRVQQRFL